MYVSVQYRRDLLETIRLNLYVARNFAWRSAAAGVVEIVVGPWVWPDAAIFFYMLGVVFIIEPPLLVCVRVYRHRELLLQEAEVTLTSEGIQRRTEAYTLRVAWDKVERVNELKGEWIFITKKPLRIFGLPKRELSQEQQAELAAFIEARQLKRQVKKMNPVREADYARAYGVARSDLKPEAQAEYDRLVAEPGPA